MHRRDFLKTTAALGAASACRPAPPAKRPTNVVFILTDDQAPHTLGVYGNHEIRTPVCDRLASEGALLTRAFCTTPVCSPSRATLLTGQIPSQHGIHDWIRDENEGPSAVRFLDGEATFTQTLADHGYRVGLSGKWHLAIARRRSRALTIGSRCRFGGTRYQNPEMYWQGEKSAYSGYPTDVVTDKANRLHRPG